MTNPNAPTTDVPAIQPLHPQELAKDGLDAMPWGHEILLAHTPHYTMKRLEMDAGKAGAFQYHREKHESFVVHSGRVEVTYVEHGVTVRVQIGAGQGFTIPPGAPHQVRAIRDSILYEASTPHFDDRVPWTGGR